MTQPGAERAVELLIGEAENATAEGRYESAISAAGRAVGAAEQLGNTNLHLRALRVEADALRMVGDPAAALARHTRILGMAQNPTIAAGLDHHATGAIVRAYTNWVDAARFTGGIPVRELFAVLDAADSWLTAIGYSDWRAAVLLQRAGVHLDIGELDQAFTYAQEALTAYGGGAPGYSLASYHHVLGDILRLTERAEEAVPHYQAILDDRTTNPRDRSIAWEGVAWCALAGDDPSAAVRYARTAVQAAEPLGDNNLALPLSALVAAHRATGDFDAAWQAATRLLHAARRIGTHRRLHLALRDAVDVALDRRDHDTARTLLDELDEHATALDTDTRSDRHRGEVAQRRRRLTQPESHLPGT